MAGKLRRKAGMESSQTARMEEASLTSKRKGISVKRFFTRPGAHPFAAVEWEKRSAVITGEKGEVVFEQHDVEIPRSWSQLATNVVVSKYFRGPLGTPQREHSVRQLISRVVNTITDWGRKDGYFASEEDAQIFSDELTHLLVEQKLAFNSPVWFNVGVEPEGKAQCSACFILSVEDTMESILDWYRKEGIIFKGGSGSGVNLSKIRSSKERLAGGGTASGPVSFMRAADASAGVIKSGGKTRRAAKMIVLNVDHPDIIEFIRCKAAEERKAWTLIEAGYDASIDGAAYSSVFFQNANNSVRVTDDFMQAIVENRPWATRFVTTGQIYETFQARDILREIADATWRCGDPGMQFDTTINAWHTRPNSGRINATNPCGEFNSLDNTACNLASLNLMEFLKDDGGFDTAAFKQAVDISITAQDIIVDNSSYPTPEITANAHAFRELGLGYANLGALLMSLGLPYDSEAGRQYAGAVTALMTGEAYLQSARLAERLGPFSGYAVNREPMLGVIDKHRSYAHKLDPSLVSLDLLSEARRSWDEALECGKRAGYRNSQATVLAPTGCLIAETILVTDTGVLPLGDLGDTRGVQWQSLQLCVASQDSPQEASRFYVNGFVPVRRIVTELGYEITGTPQHRIKVFDGQTISWKRLDEIEAGDVVPIRKNTAFGNPKVIQLNTHNNCEYNDHPEIRLPETLDEHLAELIGYFIGDGSLKSRTIRFSISGADYDLAEYIQTRLHELFGRPGTVVRDPRGDTLTVELNSKAVVDFWLNNSLGKEAPEPDHHGKGYIAFIPKVILNSNDPRIWTAFLRGLFEADGTVGSDHGPCLSTASRRLWLEVQQLLLALGVVAKSDMGRSIGHLGNQPIYRLRMANADQARLFARRVGFLSQRKSELLDVLIDREDRMATKNDILPFNVELCEELLRVVTAPKDRRTLRTVCKYGSITRDLFDSLAWRYDLAYTRLAALAAMDVCFDTVRFCEEKEAQPTFDISVPTNNTYIANGFISHNTISFMMDCDTTGVEPDIAIVKYKRLVGGGLLKMVNQTVPRALKRLGYDGKEIQEIVEYIDEHETIEDAPGLKDKHLPVFDCAFKPIKGTRSIHYLGHLKMVAAVQPFLSGAVSKTINVPSEVTVEEIADAYIQAWKLGLKAVAIYRDGCKRVQPLATGEKKKADAQPAVAVEPVPVRRRLPMDRQAICHKFEIAGHEGYIHVGFYEDSTPGEIFIKMAKEGSTISGLMDTIATLTSLALQYGVPLEALVSKFSHVRFEPSGFTKNPDIPYAKSLTDYIFRFLGSRFLSTEQKQEAGLGEEETEKRRNGETETSPLPDSPIPRFSVSFFPWQAQADAPSCADCGAIMIRNGSCYKCLNCGATSGCS